MQLIDLLIVFSSWLLSLFLTLHEVPCRSAFWIDQELGECQDVEAVLWIALVLGGASWTLGAMEPLHFMAFGQILALQQTLLSLLPGDGCRPSQRGLFLRWNLPAAWLPSLQSHLLAGLLGVLQRRQHEQLLLDTAIAKLLDTEECSPSSGGAFHTPVEEAVTSAENARHRISDFVQVLGVDHTVSALTQNYLRVLALCIHQLQTSSVDETLEQDQEQFRDQNIGGWVGSLGRSLEVEQGLTLSLSCLEKSQSREEEKDLGFKALAARSDSVQSVEEKEITALPPTIDPSIAGRIKVGKWNFDAISAVQEYPYILRIVGTELLQNFSFVSRSSLASFLCALEAKYNSEVPYHSNAHAADCANSLEVMLSNSGQDINPLRTASCYIAALGHDVGHPGVNNAFMINSRHELAITYNDRSVLESFHAAELERLLGTVRVLALPKALEHKERQVRIAYILSTDMSKHMQDLADFRLKLGCKDFDPVGNVADHQLATMWLFRASDIAHSAKPWGIHRRWSMRVVQEFHAQGDRERAMDLPISPLCDREHFELAKSQTGFLQFVCIPMWQELVRLENMVQAGGVQVMPRKSMSLNPTGDRRSRMAGPAEPLNLMPELRESHTMSLG